MDDDADDGVVKTSRGEEGASSLAHYADDGDGLHHRREQQHKQYPITPYCRS